MIKGKMAGIAFGGLAGFMILNRAFNLVENAIKHVCEASKWKNYYKYGKEGNMVAPGYSMHTHKVDDDHEIVVEKGDEDASGKPSEPSAMDVVSKTIDKIFSDDKAEKTPLEGQETPLNEEVSDPLYTETAINTGDTDGDDIPNIMDFKTDIEEDQDGETVD